MNKIEAIDNRRRFIWFNQKNPIYLNIAHISSVQFFDDSLTLDIVMFNCNKFTYTFDSKSQFEMARETMLKELQ